MGTDSTGFILDTAWLSLCRIGIRSIDADHQDIHDRIARLHEACAARRFADCRELMIGLVSAVERHFRREEAQFSRVPYPNARHHADHHRHLLNRLTAATAALADPSRLPDHILDGIDVFASVLMTDHVALDMELRAYLTSDD
ncbi:MAG: hypothetical protein EA406_02775 [Rhodospirillales bacterium]|nr:MAG: hypothetical protein EA406_02775 [Rhodospirillales bacterium]